MVAHLSIFSKACIGLYFAAIASAIPAPPHYVARQVGPIKQVIPASVTLPLDHADHNQGTFKNRYWVNDEFYKEGGPVILFDEGEAGIDASNLDSNFHFGNYDMTLAKEHNALMIRWEHRFYGKSAPNYSTVDFEDKAQTRNFYKHLTSEAALDDIAVFMKQFKWKVKGQEKALGPKTTQWVMVGGSYPGSRVAWFLKKYPDLFTMGVASSAPVELKRDFWEYFVGAERLLQDNGLQACAKDINTAATWISEAWNKNNISAFDALLAVADYTEVDISKLTRERKMTIVGNLFRLWSSSYQYAGLYNTVDSDGTISPGLGSICDYFQDGAGIQDVNGTERYKENLSSRFSPEQVAKMYIKSINDLPLTNNTTSPVTPGGGRLSKFLLADLRSHRRKQTGSLRRNKKGATSKSPTPETADEPTEILDDNTTWGYQVCTEMGFTASGNASRKTNLIPSFVNYKEYWKVNCEEEFGFTSKDEAKLDAYVEWHNNKYGGWDIQLPNIVWTHGEYDPWRFLSISTDAKEQLPARTEAPYKGIQTVPKCGKPLEKGTQLSYVIKGGNHCSDLAYDPETDSPKAVEGWGSAPPMLDAGKAIRFTLDVMKAWLKKGCSPIAKARNS